MVIRYENVWPTMYVLLIPIAFVLFMMWLIQVWMVGAPEITRVIPEYSLHVMYEPVKPASTYSSSSASGGGGKGTKYKKRTAGQPLGYARYQEPREKEHDISYASLRGMRAATPVSLDQSGYSNPAFERGTAQAYSEKSRVI